MQDVQCWKLGIKNLEVNFVTLKLETLKLET